MQEADDGFGSGVDVEFLEDLLEMPVDGPGADAEAGGDFLVDITFAEALEDIEFAGGETGQGAGGFAGDTKGESRLKVVADAEQHFGL